MLAPLFFSVRARDGGSVARALAAGAAFCALSSAVYLVNDVLDLERDRAHPVKRRRPIASGALSVPAALVAAAVLAAGALAAALGLGLPFTAAVVAYIALQGLYGAWLRHVAVLDVFCIAAGFVLRVIGGAAAIGVLVSNWLYLCTLLLALFLALAKRRAEVVLLEERAADHRRNLADYSVAFIDQLISIVCACTVLAYALYTVSPETVVRHGDDRLKYAIPFVLLGVFRYLYLVHVRGGAGEPELVLLRDRPLQAVLVGYLAVAAWAVYR